MFEPKTLRHYQAMLDSMVKAAGDEDPEGLADLAAMLHDAATNGIARAAEAQRATHGWSWARYAQAFGVTRQAVHKRLGRTS